jgi:hypothetical protein
MSCNQKIGEKYTIKAANRSFEDVEKFKYLGTILTDKSCIHEEIKSRQFDSGLFFTIILPVVLYECETWYLTLNEEHRLRVVENRVLRRIFGPKGDDVTGE